MSTKRESEIEAELQQQTKRLKDASDTVTSEFACAISKRMMREPMRSPYGHVVEAKVIQAWFAKNGSVCPLTGQPLSAAQLKPDKELRQKITQWEVARAIKRNSTSPGAAAADDDDDDIYDF